MSFYGNITDVRPTHFQFDKIFSNRAEMDRELELGIDNVFAGRFVLVRYDTDNSYVGDIIYGYQKENSTAIYLDKNCQHPYLFTTFTAVEEPNENDWENYFCKSKNRNYYFKIPNQAYFQENSEETFYTSDTLGNTIVCINRIVRIKDENDNITNLFYQCSGALNGQSAMWDEILPNDSYPVYFTNFWIDSQTYFNNFDYRGYDGTVWQKVYSEGQGKFVLIAHLNGIAPGFELVADEPSVRPEDIYIDSKSTDALYRVHTPSHWGFRIKEAEKINNEFPYSDQTVIQDYSLFDPETNELLGTSRKQINADIYFNKSGFNKEIKAYDNDGVNKLVIEPSGASGRRYANSAPGGDDPIDTYELSVHFPAFGNVVSDFYDVVYGNPEEEEGNIDNKRHLDINWYEADENMDYRINGDPLLNGKTRNLNSAAGLINTFQDRLGQILKRTNIPLTSLSNLDELDDSYIYVYTNPDTNITTYYRIGDGYEYQLIDDEDITYNNIGTLTQETYVPNNYYIKDNNDEFVVASSSWDNYTNPENIQFYQKNISTKKFERIDLMQYQQNHYYYKEDNNYYLDSAPTVPTYPSAPYYEIPASTPLNFDHYYSNDLFIKDEDGRFIKTSSINGYTPDIETTYYSLAISPIGGESQSMRLYQPGVYYYYGDDGYPKLDLTEYTYETFQLVSGRTYYAIPTSDELTYVYDAERNQVIVGYVLDEESKQQVNLYCPDTSLNNIYALNANETIFTPLNKILNKDIDYVWYQVTSSAISGDDLFIAGIYHRKQDNDYIVANEYQAGANYYLLNNVQRLPNVFYESHKYHYKNGDQYILDTDTTMSNREYYIETPLYVYNDNSGRWIYGCEWAEQSIYIPASVELATREKVKKAYELVNINNGESSINGTILKLDKLIDKDNDGTRDLSTIKGSINSIKDLTSSISGNLVPGRILFINDFGQIAITPITLTQLQTLLNRTTTLEGEVNTLKQQMTGVLSSNALGYNSANNSYGLKTKVDDILGQDALDYDSNNNSYGLKTRVDTLSATIGDNNSGLVSEVAALNTAVGDNNSGLVYAVNALNTTVGDNNSGLVSEVAALNTTVGDNNSGLVSEITALSTAVGNNSTGLIYAVNTLNTTVGDNSSGLVSEVADLDSRVQALEGQNNTPEMPVGE